MDIPQELREAVEKISTIKHTEIIEEAQAISRKYRENEGKGHKLVTKQSEAIAYAISRMPATYCAVYTALSQTLKKYKHNINSVLDVGAGTGAATWAVTNLLDVEQITCLEREAEMRKVGKQLMERKYKCRMETDRLMQRRNSRKSGFGSNFICNKRIN